MNKKQRAELASRLRQFSELGRAGVSADTALSAAAADNPVSGAKADAQVVPASFDQFLPASLPHTRALLKAGSTGESAVIAGAASELLDSQGGQSTAWSTLTISIVGAGLTVVMISIFVLPVFKDMFESFGANLPAPTLLTFFLAQWVVAPVGVLLLLLVSVNKLWKTRPSILGRYAGNIDALRMKLPLIGHATLVNETKKLAYWLAACGTYGDMRLRLNCLVELSGQSQLSRQTDALAKAMQSGKSLTDAVATPSWLPGLAMVLREAEMEANGTDEGVRKRLFAYASGLDARSDALVAKLTLIAHIFIGVVVGIFVLGMYLPIFKMGSAI